MLDGFIIDRIRREKRQEGLERLPLRIEVPRPPMPEARPRQQPRQDEQDPHIVDFSI